MFFISQVIENTQAAMVALFLPGIFRIFATVYLEVINRREAANTKKKHIADAMLFSQNETSQLCDNISKQLQGTWNGYKRNENESDGNWNKRNHSEHKNIGREKV